MSFANVLSLLGGLGLFLFGMKIMGEGLEKAAGNRLKSLLEMVTHNRVLAMLSKAVSLPSRSARSNSAIPLLIHAFLILSQYFFFR